MCRESVGLIDGPYPQAMPEFENLEKYACKSKDGKMSVSPIAPHSLQAVDYTPGRRGRATEPREKLKPLPDATIEPVDIRQMEREFRKASRDQSPGLAVQLKGLFRRLKAWFGKLSTRKKPHRGRHDRKRGDKRPRSGGGPKHKGNAPKGGQQDDKGRRPRRRNRRGNQDGGQGGNRGGNQGGGQSGNRHQNRPEGKSGTQGGGNRPAGPENQGSGNPPKRKRKRNRNRGPSQGGGKQQDGGNRDNRDF